MINTSAVTLIPSTIFVYRAQMGAADPTDVFLPILVATFCSSMVGLIVTSFFQRIKLLQPVVLGYLGGMTALIVAMMLYFSRLDQATMEAQSSLLSNLIIFGVMFGFVALAAFKKVPVYESFVEGAKDGFEVAIGIIPYLVAMLIAIGVFRASGALELVLGGFRAVVETAGIDSRFIDGIPTALMRPLSGSGARGLMVETMQAQGADSFAGRLVSILQGSTETTFYVLAVYFGSVGIKRARHAVACGLSADLAGVVAAILVTYLFFG